MRSMMFELSSISILCLALSGCSLEKDVQTICMAPVEAKIADVSPDERQKLLAMHIDDNLKTSEAREFFEALASATPETKVEFCERIIKESGYVGECPMLDEMKVAAKREAAFKAELIELCATPESIDTEDPADHWPATVGLIQKAAKSDRSKPLLEAIEARQYGVALDQLERHTYVLDGEKCALRGYLSKLADGAK